MLVLLCDLRRAGDVNPLICGDCRENPGTYLPRLPLEIAKSTPLRSNSLGQAMSVGPGIRMNTNHVEAPRADSSIPNDGP